MVTKRQQRAFVKNFPLTQKIVKMNYTTDKVAATFRQYCDGHTCAIYQKAFSPKCEFDGCNSYGYMGISRKNSRPVYVSSTKVTPKYMKRHEFVFNENVISFLVKKGLLK